MGFDKRAAVTSVWRESVVAAQAARLPASVRRLQAMERYAQALVAGAGRWVPELDGHLVHAAAACVEDRFAEVLKDVALAYPCPLPAGIPPARVLPGAGGAYLVLVGREAFLLQLPQGEGQGSRRVRISVPLELSHAEILQTRRGRAEHLRTWPDENTLRPLMDERARQLAAQQQRESFSRAFAGSLCDGPDWRKTIRTFATGVQSVYVRQSRRPRRHSRQATRMVVPVVWVFDDQCPVSDHRATEELLDRAQDLWRYSSFLYVASHHQLPAAL
jgi:hypothetical protein